MAMVSSSGSSATSGSSVVDQVAVGRHPREGRMPAMIAISAGFGVGLVLAAGFALFGPGPITGIVVLAVVTVVLSWLSTVPGALGIGAMSWLFYSGFVVHGQGQLAVSGTRDAVAAAILVGLGLVVSLSRAALSYRRVGYPEIHLPHPRRSHEDPDHALAEQAG